MEVANQISSLNNDTLIHVLDYLDDTNAIVAFCLTSKGFLEQLVSVIQPKLRNALPFSYDKCTSLIKKVKIYRSLISARDTAPGLQFFEFECPRASSQVRLEAYQVITKMLPWNSKMFVEISVAQSLVQKGPAYFCVYSMDQAAPIFTTDLLNGKDPNKSVLVFEALAFNSKLKYFALAYRYIYDSQSIKQVVRIYSIKGENSVELMLNEEYEKIKRSPPTFPDISMAMTDQGDLWISHFYDGPASISIADKKIMKLDVDPAMKDIKFIEHKGKALLVGEIEEEGALCIRIDDVAQNITTQRHQITNMRLFLVGVKGDLLVFKAFIYGKKMEYFAIDLEKRTRVNIGEASVSFSGKYLLDQKLDQLSIMSLTNGAKSDELSAKLSYNMANSGCIFQWSSNSDTVVASVPYKRCLVVGQAPNTLSFYGTVEETYSLDNGSTLVKFQHKSSADRAIQQLSAASQKQGEQSRSGFGTSFFGFNSVKLGDNITENKRPGLGILHLESAKKRRTAEVPSFDLPFDSELVITDCVVSDDQKQLFVAGTCGLQTIVLKMRL